MKPIRKPADKLTPADLEQYPIWEFALDEECEEGQIKLPYALLQ